MKIVNVVGARPNFIKIAPLMREMRKHSEIQPILVHTGQHYDEHLSDIFFRQLGISEPDVDLQVGSGCSDEPYPFALMTLHRPSNVDSPATLQALLQSVEEIAERIPVVFPVHPRTQLRIEALKAKVHSQVRLIPPVGYLDFLWLMSRARFVMTDSGGIQEETTALGVPCLTLRENTERPITVEQGTNQIVGTEPERIISAAHRILSSERRRGRTPLLWDGDASQRIVDVLLRESREPSDRFSVSAHS